MKQLQAKQIIISLAVILILMTSGILMAQNKDEVKSKLDKLNGKVEKITVMVDGKDVVFEGKEAQELSDKLRASKEKKMVWMTGDGHDVKMSGGKKFKFMHLDNGDLQGGDAEKKVKVEIVDGKKKISVTTIKDGKEETKVYEGKEAEEFLKQDSAEAEFDIQIDTEAGDEDVMIFRSAPNHGCCCCGASMQHRSGGPAHKKVIIKELKKDDLKHVEEK